MIKKELIDEVARRLVGVYSPEAIYLFGSYAWGNPDKESDLDILVVVKESSEKSYKRSNVGSWQLIDLMVPNDLLVYTEKEFKELSRDRTTLCYKVKTEGKVLYGKS